MKEIRPIVNRVRVVIESKYEDGLSHRTVAERRFDGSAYTLLDVLPTFEDALRGHGFHCSTDALQIVGEDEDIVKRTAYRSSRLTSGGA